MGAAADQAEGEFRDKPTILLVEDDVLLRISTADYLRSSGYHVVEAGTVIEAATVLSGGAPVQAIFSDVDLPGATGGLSFAVWVHTYYPAIPVILTSGVRAVMPALNTQQGVRFVPKPYDLETVAIIIAGAIADAASRSG